MPFFLFVKSVEKTHVYLWSSQQLKNGKELTALLRRI